MTTPFWSRSKLPSSSDICTDVAIIGGGYVGLSLAYWLTEFRPELKVTVVERRTCGAGASGRNAGFLTMGSASFYKGLVKDWGEERAREVHQFAGQSLGLVHDKILKNSDSIKFEKSSSMTLFQTQKQFDEWKVADFSPEVFNFKWIDREKMPPKIQGRFVGGFENGPEYKINPVELLSELKRILEKRKVEIIEGNSAFKITQAGVETEFNTIKTQKVALALNGYFPEFHNAFKSIIAPKRAQMLAVKLEEDFDCPHLYYDPPERVYWRKSFNNTLLIGGKRLLDESGEVGNFEKISGPIQDGLELYLKEQLNLKYKVINRWSGTMGFTGHELPLSGRIGAPVETYIIGGFSGHGMGLGFRSAQDLAQVIVSQQKESFFERFKRVDFTI